MILSPAQAREDFDITNYQVNITLQPNGSCNVTERIEVDFTKKRHGLYRTIPFRYRATPIDDNGPRAKRAASTKNYYEILVQNINVESKTFQVFEEGDFLKIRIGDPDSYVYGKEVYTITYTVWGALNDFDNWVEFTWNAVGNDWDTDIQKASVVVNLAKPVNLNKEDMAVFTGSLGSKEHNATITKNGNTIVANTSRALSPYEGMTVGLKFPKGYFSTTEIPIAAYAQQYYVKNHTSSITINKDASLDVAETYVVTFIKETSSFTRAFNNAPFSDNSNGERRQMIVLDEQDVYVKLSPTTACDYHIQRSDENNDILLIKSKAKPFLGTYTFTFKYKLWGAISKNGNSALVRWDVLNSLQEEPVEHSNFTVNGAVDLKIDTSSFQLLASGRAKEDDLMLNGFSGGLSNRLVHGGYYQLTLQCSASSLDFSRVPMGVYAKFYTIEDMNVEAHLQNDGGIRLKYKLKPKFLYKHNKATFQPPIIQHFIEGRMGEIVPNRSILSHHEYMIVDDIKTPTNIATEIVKDPILGKKILIKDENWNESSPYFEYEYTIYGLWNDKIDGKNILQFPLILQPNEPIERAAIRVYYPDGLKSEEVYLQGSIDGMMPTITFDKRTSFEITSIDQPIIPNHPFVLKMSIPESHSLDVSFITAIELWCINNIWYLLGIIGGIGFAVIWFFFGKDEKPTIMVHFEPPFDITPAEAGYLFDEKLHKKDLISLIFYWANKGFLNIKELENNDYQLSKIKPLPGSAKQFEKTFFSGLFETGDVIKVSSLRNKFYTHLQQSFRDMYAHSKAVGMFNRGSFTSQKLIMLVGFILLIASIMSAILGAFVWEDYSISIGLGLMAISAIVFGWLMPKKGKWGVEKYAQTMGFYEFVKTAEIDRLKVLVKDNPKYFEMTIAYAIVFGLGKQWANRFKDIEMATPEWYEGSTSYPMFNSILFTNNMLNGMRHINDDLSYVEHTSRSGSGGSTFSGGGGFSGGGFGGGGGGSW
ncbi:MAG: DUF2207 domain-containing protein [Saprospiraceae bacterium]|nr:DUF2207 domain-containing protein [Saprospiraceae bacterium]